MSARRARDPLFFFLIAPGTGLQLGCGRPRPGMSLILLNFLSPGGVNRSPALRVLYIITQQRCVMSFQSCCCFFFLHFSLIGEKAPPLIPFVFSGSKLLGAGLLLFQLGPAGRIRASIILRCTVGDCLFFFFRSDSIRSVTSISYSLDCITALESR